VAWAGSFSVILSEGGYGLNDAICDGTDGNWTHPNVKLLRGAYMSRWMLALAADHALFALPYSDKDQNWMTFIGNGGSPGTTYCTQPAFTGSTAVQAAFNQTQTWLNSVVVPNGSSISCVSVTGGNVCTLAVTQSGAAAEFKCFTGWLSNFTQSTTYTTQQTLDGTTSSTGGSVTLNMQPMLLTTPTAPTVATPTASPVPGIYPSTQTVTLSDATSGAAIHYTLDSSTPTIASPLYSAPLTISTTTIVKAIGTKTGMTSSTVFNAAGTPYSIVPPPPTVVRSSILVTSGVN